MTEPQPIPDIRRHQAHAELFDKLSKLRAFLSMLHAGGFEHFRAMDEVRQAEYLWTCLDYAEGAYKALTIYDGMDVSAGGDCDPQCLLNVYPNTQAKDWSLP